MPEDGQYDRNVQHVVMGLIRCVVGGSACVSFEYPAVIFRRTNTSGIHTGTIKTKPFRTCVSPLPTRKCAVSR